MSKLLQKIKSWYDKEHIYPGRDWQVLLFAESFLVIILAIFAFYFYIQIDQGKIFSATGEEEISQTVVNKELLNQTISDINLRKENFTKIEQNKITTSDPSL